MLSAQQHVSHVPYYGQRHVELDSIAIESREHLAEVLHQHEEHHDPHQVDNHDLKQNYEIK